MKPNKWYILLAIVLAASILAIIFTTMVANAWDNPNFYGKPIEFESTAYCETGNPTKSGAYPMEGRTIAVDKNVIPLGSKVIIDNHEYIAEDIGGAIKGNKVDIFVSDHETAIQRGKIQREVELVR